MPPGSDGSASPSYRYAVGLASYGRAEGLCQAGHRRAPGRGAAAAQPAMSEADSPARSSSPSGRCAVDVFPSLRAPGWTGRRRCWRRDDIQTPGARVALVPSGPQAGRCGR
jgi:hypothetical protein